jgi:hypothetical protein
MKEFDQEHYFQAEKICEDAYEKKFNCDLSWDRNDPRRKQCTTVDEIKQNLTDQITMWEELGDTESSVDVKTDPVKNALRVLCTQKKTNCYERLMSLEKITNNDVIPEIAPNNICTCGKITLKRCPKCRIKTYCSRVCRKKDRQNHLKECKKD